MGQRVVHFEITADDPRRAVEFYSKTFGWEFDSWGGPETYFLASTGKDVPGIDGAVTERFEHGQPIVNTIGVESYEDAAQRVRANGGQVIQDKQAIPGVGWFSYCRDTEGNVFGIMQPDESAR